MEISASVRNAVSESENATTVAAGSNSVNPVRGAKISPLNIYPYLKSRSQEGRAKTKAKLRTRGPIEKPKVGAI